MDIKALLEKLGQQFTAEEYEDFQSFTISKLWKDYNDDCMEKATVIKNRIDALDIKFPNGTVNKEYSASFSLPKEDAYDIEIEGADGVGAAAVIDKETNLCKIQGTPVQAGDFEITVKYKYTGWVPGKQELSRVFRIAINPDPRTLWKDIPTPTDIDYYQPDYDSAYIKVEAIDGIPQKDIVVASKRGRSHGHEGKPRDDHFMVKYLEENSWYIMAVADGAGSAKYSRRGSTIACETAVEHCSSILASDTDFEEFIKMYQTEKKADNQKLLGDYIYQIVGNAAFKAHKAINAEASNRGCPAKDFATTLLLAVAKKFDFGWFIASFWVGDGALCIYDKERKYIKLMGTPDGGEFAGQTRFLTMPEIFSDAASFYGRLRVAIEPDFTALMLMSDGISDPKFETDANLNKVEKWDALWKDLAGDNEFRVKVDLSDDNSESQYQLLEWLDFWSPGNHDDRTLAIMY